MKYNYLHIYFILIIALMLYVFCNAGAISANLEQKNFPIVIHSSLRKLAEFCPFLEKYQSYKTFLSQFDKEIITEPEETPDPEQKQEKLVCADTHASQQKKEADNLSIEIKNDLLPPPIVSIEVKRASPLTQDLAPIEKEDSLSSSLSSSSSSSLSSSSLSSSLFPPSAEETAATYKKVTQQIKTPYKVLLVGDSFMEDMYSSILRNKIFQYEKKIKYCSIAKFSTGLATGKLYNWFTALRHNIEIHKPDIIIINIGVNDINPILYLNEKKIPFNSPNWETRYREIVEEFIDLALVHKIKVIWVGLPIMGEKIKARWIPRVEKTQRAACQNKGVEYIDTTTLLADKEGKYQAYMQMPDGEEKRIRQKDDYHISPDGEKLILNKVFPVLLKTIYEMEMKKSESSAKAE